MRHLLFNSLENKQQSCACIQLRDILRRHNPIAILSIFSANLTMKLVNPLLFSALLAVAIATDSQKPLSNEECVDPPYKIHLFSRSPLVIYISGFITPEESEYLLSLGENTFQHSSVTHGNTSATLKHRTSSSTPLSPQDPRVKCIELRALRFQGLLTNPHPPTTPNREQQERDEAQERIARSHLEPIQLVRYRESQHFHFHTDWFTDPSQAELSSGGQRISSFFAYLATSDDLRGGGTNFPVLDGPDMQVSFSPSANGGGLAFGPGGEGWCEFVDCDEEREKGVTFRPIRGNAVFWENVLPGSAEGDSRNLHAGLPVRRGWKVGMNIWTREAPLPKGVRGG